MNGFRDTGDALEVPEGERLPLDDFLPEEVNEDEFVDLSDVPEGEVVRLSTADLDEEND